MKGNLEKITRGTEHLGQSCVFCQQDIQAEDEVIACPRCRSPHHVHCWKDKGGCGKTGCPQVAQAVRGERPQGDGPPPPISRKVIALGVVAIAAIILAFIFWPKPPDPAMGRAKVVFMGEAYFELSEALTELAKEYNATSETTYIDLQLLPPGAMDTKLIVLIAANEAPDVMAIDDDRFAYFLENDVLLPLGEDESGEPIYGMQHPAQLTKLVVWSDTDHPQQALEVLHYFVDHIPPLDLNLLRELESQPWPFGIE
ncbi:MAG: extracellular solute-binding protein [Firmicutes bacterium]|nr:extracellular solute-binding protein [Bacillota bacterium]